MRKRLLLIVLFVLAIGLAAYGYVSRHTDPPACQTNPWLKGTTITGNGKSVEAEVAIEPEDKQQGLSDRNCLGKNKAMLFSYDLPNDYCFWMKDMHFSLDMIWLDDDKKIVTVKSGVSPRTYPESFCPSKPAQYIIEVASGVTAQLGWRVGTQLNF